MSTATVSSAAAQTVSARQIKALQARTEQGWLRSEFIKGKLKCARQTAYTWDLILLESVNDYGSDPNTRRSLWEPKQIWNAHQQWCLLKVKKYMAATPKPTLEDLKNHLTRNQNLYDHKQFFTETFDYDITRISKNA
jgi:hypothetical protein